MLLITTSRGPCKNTRKLAQTLARLLGAEYVVRGKKNTFALVDWARSTGAGRVLIITDFKGNPGRLEFMRVTGRDWEWAESWRIRGIVLPANPKTLPVFAGARVTGALKEKAAQAFSIEEDEEAQLCLEARRESLTFKNKVIFVQIRLAA